ncbi:MAG: hypothetical protein Q8880_03005 [Bacteroidota bacterium]|nr:hypothetical protein [Bacteroidota bacterium]
MNTNNISIEDFLIQHLIENKKYEDISDKYGLESKELTKMWDSNEGLKIREDIKKAKQIFNNRKNNPDFK